MAKPTIANVAELAGVSQATVSEHFVARPTSQKRPASKFSGQRINSTSHSQKALPP